MSSARSVAVIADVAAPGTDPELLAAVLAWLVRPRWGPQTLRNACAEVAGSPGPTAALRAVVDRPDRSQLEAVATLARQWEARGVQVALVGDPAYPHRLARGWPQTAAPPFLAWRGRTCGDGPAVALVGARRATGYGTGVAAWLAEAASRAGVRVVSGGAIGIDAAAHEAALDGPGGTTVVLGCGHAVGYPRPHAAPGGLFDRILAHGGSVASELWPTQPPRAGAVRARNRIVAGLADAVVVVEGGERSGALVTATAAAELGVAVLAVPGDVRAPGSAAPHRLLAEGATPCTSPADLLEALGAAAPAGPTEDGVARPGSLPPEVHDLLAAAWPRPLRVDELAARSGRSAGTLLAAVTRARVAGEVAEGPDGVRLRRAP